MNEKEIRKQIRELRDEMREKGIKRTSCFNGGLSPDTYRCNAELFKLQVALDTVKGKKVR